MNKVSIVETGLQTEVKTTLIRRFKDFLDSKRQDEWGLQVDGITSMQTLRNSTTWKKWRANWLRRRKQINQYYNRDIKSPEDFLSVQTHVLAPERLCFYLAAYTCIAQDHEKEVVEDVRMRWKEVRGNDQNRLPEK